MLKKLFQVACDKIAKKLLSYANADGVTSVAAVFDDDEIEDMNTPAPSQPSEKIPQNLNSFKRGFFEKSLEGGVASLHFDASVAGVEVPDQFRGVAQLVLNYSYRYHIADFHFDDERVIASLSFNGTPHRCVVPWHAVFGVGNRGEGMFYQFDDTSQKADTSADKENTGLRLIVGESNTTDVMQSNSKPKLYVIKGGKSA